MEENKLNICSTAPPEAECFQYINPPEPQPGITNGRWFGKDNYQYDPREDETLSIVCIASVDYLRIKTNIFIMLTKTIRLFPEQLIGRKGYAHTCFLSIQGNHLL